MCLITEQLEPLIAEEDMEVRKVLTSNRLSLFYHLSRMYYEENQLYKTEIKDSNDWSFFGTADDCYFRNGRWLTKNLRCIGQGFHYFIVGSPSAKEMSYEQNYRATIPKGASYFVGPTGCVVSDAIIVHEKVGEGL